MSLRPRAPKPARPLNGLPDDETLLKAINESRTLDVGALAQAYGLKGDERRALRQRLKSLSSSGKIDKTGRKTFQAQGSLPETGVAEGVFLDENGDLWVQWGQAETGRRHERDRIASPNKAPLARLLPIAASTNSPAPAVGDRLFVRFDKIDDQWTAKLIKLLDQGAKRFVGVARQSRHGFKLESVDRKSRDVYQVPDATSLNLKDGDICLAQSSAGAGHMYGPKPCRILEVIGTEADPKCASVMAIANHGLKIGFAPETEREAENATLPALGKRTDLRHLDLITIDPVDARDHDDAVYALFDTDEKNQGGVIVWVAIADVAHYVTSGSSLDREAKEKGNSTYFPDRVEPMLPHALSSNLCSLRPNEDRASLVVKLVFDDQGMKKSHRFYRALIRSRAKLSYEQAQNAFDGAFDETTKPLWESILAPLWQAHALLTKGRLTRHPLEINSPERKVHLNEDGTVRAIEPRPSLEAHKLIEEMMIQANVAAAESLEAQRLGLIYRVHEAPSMEKLINFADFLSTLSFDWARGEPPRTERFNQVLRKFTDTEHAESVNEVVLRSQMQAHYAPENFGHFGLSLNSYAHFTSPIRRYADVIVHRALIRALKLGEDGLSDYELKILKDIAEHITMCERRSMAAERETIDRYVASFLSDRVGGQFSGRICGVTRFGLFVKLSETGADGIVPIRTLGDEYFIHDDQAHALVGERTKQRYRLGTLVDVRLIEAMPLTGGLVFEMLSPPDAPDPTRKAPRLGLRSRDQKNPHAHRSREKSPPKAHKKGKKR